jgi:hypothetical protein
MGSPWVYFALAELLYLPVVLVYTRRFEDLSFGEYTMQQAERRSMLL